MTPELAAKIRALASDLRADPATRAIAQAKLDEAGMAEMPRPIPGPRHPGLHISDEHRRWMRAQRKANPLVRE